MKKKIEPIDWPVLNARLMGKPLSDAAEEVCKLLVEKVNEIVKDYNEKH